MSSELSHTNTGLKRNRYTGACDYCKKRKIKCDSARGLDNACSNCLAVGYDCTHEVMVKFKSKGYVGRLEQRIQKMESLLHDLLPDVDIDKELEKLDDREDSTIPSVIDSKPNFRILPPTQPRALLHMRPEFWDPRPWEVPFQAYEAPVYIFPDESLLWDLISLYFANVNYMYPLLHRPTFQHNVLQNRHLEDYHFGGLVALVCAVGARFSLDERVKVPGYPPSAGYMWYDQVLVLRRPYSKKITLFEMQQHILSIWYEHAAGLKGSWVTTGIALRLWQDSPAPPTTASIEHELWKRAGWILYSIDGILGSFSGRASTCDKQVLLESVAYPREVDDEFWDTFEQPHNQPSNITFFVQFIKLMDILGEILSTTYHVKAPSRLPSSASINTTMSQWLKSLPEFLRWPSATHAAQSIYLSGLYYHLQMLSNRPFLPTVNAQSHFSRPSFDICVTSASAVTAMIHASSTTIHPAIYPPHMQLIVLSTGLVLLLKVWNDRFVPELVHTGLGNVQICIDFLVACRDVWYDATKLVHLLSGLKILASGLPHSSTSKHPRDYDEREGDLEQVLFLEDPSTIGSKFDFTQDMFNLVDVFNSANTEFWGMSFGDTGSQSWDPCAFEDFVSWDGPGINAT